MVNLQKTINKNFIGNKNYTRAKQKYLTFNMGGMGIPHIETKVLAATSFWIKQLINYSRLKEHLRPLALTVPINTMKHWNLDIEDLLNATENDLKALNHLIGTFYGSQLWKNIFRNISEIRKTVEHRI